MTQQLQILGNKNSQADNKLYVVLDSPVIHFLKECIVSAAFLFVSCPLQTVHGLDSRHRTSAKITLFQTKFNSKYIISELDDKLL